MLELDQVFRRSTVRARIAANPIGPILRRYVRYLVKRGHQAGPLHQYVFAAEHFGRCLGKRAISRAAVDSFIQSHLPRCRCPKPCACDIHCVRAALNRLLAMLDGGGSESVVEAGVAGHILRRYERHLRDNCGLSNATVHYRLRYARDLLRHFDVRHSREFRHWTAARIAQYISSVGGRHKASSGQVLASSIRDFLRFLLLRGMIQRDLSAAVSSFANWRLSSLPAFVAQSDLQKLVDAVDHSTPVGMRDRAVLLCLTELGLRDSEVAGMCREGVDLSAGVLRLRRPKQRDQIELPLTPRLAKAIRLYLDQGRPKCDSPALFVIHRAPVGGSLRSIGIRGIVIRRAAEAGLAGRVRGTHVIRHSVATAMINHGASLKAIADLLGHQSINTTSIYAKVDLRSLTGVALPWPPAKGVLS